MFQSRPNYPKLNTNLKLARNRLKLLIKKKSEIAFKSRKEIADLIEANKVERAKIRVEHIIREDFLVEAMEIVESFCDLFSARFGLVEHTQNVDEGLAEAIASIIWVTPRMLMDVPELATLTKQLTLKYGKEYVAACHDNTIGKVSSNLMQKLSIQAPSKILVEKYLIEICQYYSVLYAPDPSVVSAENGPDGYLINFNDLNCNIGPQDPPAGTPGSGGGGGGGGAVSAPNQFNVESNKLNLPPAPIGFVAPVPSNLDLLSDRKPTVGAQAPGDPAAGVSGQTQPAPVPPAGAKQPAPLAAPRQSPNMALPDLPTVPPVLAMPSDVNFDDLTKRFEALKKQNK